MMAHTNQLFSLFRRIETIRARLKKSLVRVHLLICARKCKVTPLPPPFLFLSYRHNYNLIVSCRLINFEQNPLCRFLRQVPPLGGTHGIQ
jgi:hypothetical protein